MASSVFVWPGFFSFNGSQIIFPYPGLFPDASAAAPSIASSTEPSTGYFFSATGTAIDTSISGTARYRVSASELQLRSGNALAWSSGNIGATSDVTVVRTAAGSLAARDGVNGKSFNFINQLTELTTIAAAATTTTTIQMPANSVVLGVSVRVTTVIPTATSFSVGDSGSATRFSTANVSVAATSTDPGTKAGAYYNATAAGILLTMNGGTPASNTGRVRVTIYYYSVTPPTS